MLVKARFLFYLFPIAIFSTSVTVSAIFVIEKCMTLNLTFRGKIKSKYAIERPCATSYTLAIAMFTLSVTAYELVTYELPNVLDWNLWPLKCRSMTLTIENWQCELSLSTCMCAKVGSFRSSRFYPVHFVTDIRMYGSLFTLPDSIIEYNSV